VTLLNKYLDKVYNEIYDERRPEKMQDPTDYGSNSGTYIMKGLSIQDVSEIHVDKVERQFLISVFMNNGNIIDGELILGYGSMGRGEAYSYIDYIEFDEEFYEEINDELREEITNAIENELNKIFQVLGVPTANKRRS
jgi:hypothetical protein